MVHPRKRRFFVRAESSSPNKDEPFKVTFVGPHGSGKTSIVHLFYDKVFSVNIASTIWVLYMIKNISRGTALLHMGHHRP
jgi:GTPase SAR1 family protein